MRSRDETSGLFANPARRSRLKLHGRVWFAPGPGEGGRIGQWGGGIRQLAEVVARLHVLDPARVGRLPVQHLAGLVV
jgi:hypothetical protein